MADGLRLCRCKIAFICLLPLTSSEVRNHREAEADDQSIDSLHLLEDGADLLVRKKGGLRVVVKTVGVFVL